MTPEEVRASLRRYRRTHDPRDGDLLIRSHYRPIAKIARGYRWSRQELADLIQARCLGFLRAVAAA